MSSSTALNLMD